MSRVMDTIVNTDLRKAEPALKKYFKYMVTSRKLSIKFMPSKVKEIISDDLLIDITTYSDLLQTVSVEMFSFYIQTWPGWQTPEKFQMCIDNPEESYHKFRRYLKEKISSLPEKQKLYEKSEEGHNEFVETRGYVLNPPSDSLKLLRTENSKRKVKFAHTLEITANPKLFNSLHFQSDNGKITVSIAKQIPRARNISTVGAINHPYVSVLFKLPGLIKYSRKNVHRVEMFLCRSSDNWQFPTQDRIVDIRKYPARTGVYTSNFMKMLFNNITSEMEKHSLKVICYLL